MVKATALSLTFGQKKKNKVHNTFKCNVAN